MSQSKDTYGFYTRNAMNDFIVTLKDTDKKVDIEASERLNSLGRWVWNSGSSLRLQTQKTSQEVAAVFTAETGLSTKDYSIMNIAGILFPKE